MEKEMGGGGPVSCETDIYGALSEYIGMRVSGDTVTLRGIAESDITFYRLQCDSDGALRSYIAQGEILPVRTRSFGGIGGLKACTSPILPIKR